MDIGNLQGEPLMVAVIFTGLMLFLGIIAVSFRGSVQF